MARRSKRVGLSVAVIDNTLLTRLVSSEIVKFLPYLFKRILIPPEVKKEAYKAPHKGKRRLRKAIGEMGNFFVDCYQANDFTKEYLKADLDEGEAATIAQAEVTDAIILIDELKGFKIAKRMQLRTIRTGRLLIMLKDEGAIDEIQPYIQKLRKAGFHLDEKVMHKLLAEAGEHSSD